MTNLIYRYISPFLALLAIMALGSFTLAACAGSNASKGPTAGQLADAGKTVYQQYCVRCHGENGQNINGSALLGPDNILANYQTAQGLYDYASKLMPDDQPGSLTPEQYLQVVSFLMVQDKYVKPDLPIDSSKLDQVLLSK
jgi:S-disulfanyl-L-cysteine oxidoreductase SoxD